MANENKAIDRKTCNVDAFVTTTPEGTIGDVPLVQPVETPEPKTKAEREADEEKIRQEHEAEEKKAATKKTKPQSDKK